MTEDKRRPDSPPAAPGENDRTTGEPESHGQAPQRQSDASSGKAGFSSADPPKAPSGLGSSLQPGGTVPGGGPGATEGSLGTGGGQTADQDTGSLKRNGR